MNPNTFFLEVPEEQIEVVVGDEKQLDACYPRAKIKVWDNESNISVGWNIPIEDMEVSTDQEKIIFSKDSVDAEFYLVQENQKIPVNKIRRVLKGEEITAIQSTSEYEMFNQISEHGTFHLAHYVVTEPSLAVFDKMPAELHLEMVAGYATDFDYADKSAYHPADIPMPSNGPVKLCRFFTPYAPVVNPYYMDAGIHNIDMQYYSGELPGSSADMLMTAIQNVLLRDYNIETTRHPTRTKLYFDHNGRSVKFFSCQEEDKGCYGYINISSSYNKAYDFYRPQIEKDIRDQYAYGLQFAYPEINHSFVEDVIQEFAAILNVPLNDEPYTSEEQARWDSLAARHDNIEWTENANRLDANYFHMRQKDGLEMMFVLNSIPPTNEIPISFSVPKNSTAYVQAPLSLEEYLNGSSRPDDVVNSIAIYHSETIFRGLNSKYKTGKIAHIYRPYATDADGLSVWCDFLEVVGQQDGTIISLEDGLTVVIPQWFLNEAVYPIKVDPTFGYAVVGGTNATITNTIKATLHTNTLTGKVSSIVAYVTNTGGGTPSECAVYSSADALVAQTANTSTVVSAVWVNYAFASMPTINASTDYKLAIWAGAGGGYGGFFTVSYDSTDGKTSYTKAETYVADTWPDPFASYTTESNRQYSIYANIVVGNPYFDNFIGRK